jgi:hypothetical protein
MQTFLPFESFDETARVLDYRRLGKQRVECKQILLSIIYDRGWNHHPIVRMWRGYECCLIDYAKTICKEWIRRGYKDSVLLWLNEFEHSYDFKRYNVFNIDSWCNKDYRPGWLGNKDFHLSHQSNLLRKDFDYYSTKGFWTKDDSLPYLWF